MAETIASPGVLANENDQSPITTQPVQAGAAIIGPTVKGPVEIPTIVTSYSDYTNKYGDKFLSGSTEYTYFTSISAYNYFNSGGSSLLVTRVTSGSFTPATSSLIPDSGSLNNVFTLETLSEGEIMNSTSTLNTDGSLPSGSVDNVRWQIVSPDTDEGTFNLLIRRGNDDTNSPVVLESWDNLSLDPKASNYVEKIIGNQTQTIATDGSDTYLQLTGEYANQSRYVRVKQVDFKTPDYIDNQGDPVTAYTASIPIVSSGSFGSAVGSNISTNEGKYYENIDNTNVQGLISSDYTQAIALLSNKEEYKYNFITAPGLINSLASHTSEISSLTSNCQSRGDTMLILDLVAYNTNVTPTTTAATSINNSYAATYWPWLQTLDPNTGAQVWVPASTIIPSVYAFNDATSEVWFAPAGNSRGVMSTVLRAERKLTLGNRDTLYKKNVNPLTTQTGVGVVVFGQKTLQKKKSALDRVNVRRLLINLKSTISQIADNFVFEQNDVTNRNSLTSQINSYLTSVQQRQGLYAYNVVMDESNNTSTVIDNNQLIGQIFIQPTRTAEFIILDFNILPTGATFE